MRRRFRHSIPSALTLSLPILMQLACQDGGVSSSSTGGSASADASTGGTNSTGGSGSSLPWDEEIAEPAQARSPYIVVDQFGYLPDAEKIAVLRDPEVGFDAGETFSPGPAYQVVDAQSGMSVLELAPTPFAGGEVNEQSGDRARWIDFSAVSTPGLYFLLDVQNQVRSDVFRISDDVYRRVLREAFRTFFYQRAGYAKELPYAEEGWVDAASHMGPGQDPSARLYGSESDASTERDVSGGWYDAGDYNKYTAWTADYVITLLRAYEESPQAFGDDFGIPESGNQISDLLDEVRFGLTHLERLQLDTGAFLSIVALDHASPPSSAAAPSVYGPESTNATIRAGTAMAFGARLFQEVDSTFADALKERAISAFDWAAENPNVTFENTGKLGAGEQEVRAEDLELFRLGFAVSLFRVSGDPNHLAPFEEQYDSAGLSMLDGYNAAWQLQFTEYYLDYAQLSEAKPEIKSDILDAFQSTIASADNLGQVTAATDPYLAYIANYTWGSNSHKSRTGCLLYDVNAFQTGDDLAEASRRAAERYVHYLHGVNPLNLVYLSNMGRFGAANSVTTFYHSWFTDQSPAWDAVGTSTYGPAPGFLAGGPNPSYDWDAQCPGHSSCPADRPSPPFGQPDMKSYLDFNDNWPVNSWAVTENSNGYQVYYLRLLSKFVR